MVPRAREPELAAFDDPFSQTWLGMVKGMEVTLQSANGQYLKAENRGGGRVLANADIPDSWETFYLIDTNGGKLETGDTVGFLTYDHRHHLTAEEGGVVGGGPENLLNATREEFSSWQKFIVQKVGNGEEISSGDRITLQANGNGFLTTDAAEGECGGGLVHASSTSAGDCGKFTITIKSGPLVLFDKDAANFDSADNALKGTYIWGRFGLNWTKDEEGNLNTHPKSGHWSMNMAKVIGSAPGTLMIGEKDEWWDKFIWTHGQGAVIGGLVALDSENEWCYQKNADGRSGTLYFKPAKEVDPNNLTIELKQRQWIVDANSSYIVFSNLDFLGGQIRLIGNNNLLDNIKVTYGTHFAYRHTIGEAKGYNDGNNGVYIDGDDNEVRNSEIAYSAGSGMVIQGDRNVVDNCLIHDFGYMGTFTSGVYFNGYGAQLTHSTLFNSGRDILHLGKCTACNVTHNLLHDSTILTDDSGAIYSFGHDLHGTEIAYNWIQSVTNPNRGLSKIQIGIYLDNGSRNAFVHHNLIVGQGQHPGIQTNSPHEGLLINNNTIIHNKAINSEGNPISFNKTGEGAYCNCDFDANPELQPKFYFETINECVHERNSSGDVTSSYCINPDDTYWMDSSRLNVVDTLYYASFDQARQDLNNPQEVVTDDNGWEIINAPDFRPKSSATYQGAYDYDGNNWIPGYTLVPRNVIDRGAPVGRVISLRSRANGRYVCADRDIHNNNAPLYASRDWVKTWERFYVEEAGGGTVALKSLATDKYISADFGIGGKLVANRDHVLEWEKFFWVINDDETISFISKRNHKYVGAENSGNEQLQAVNGEIENEEKFTFSQAPIGQIVSFQSLANNRYICADRNIHFDNAPLYANRDWMYDWEKFRVEDAGNGYIALKSLATGKYVSADFGIGGKLVANRDNVLEWEKFFWVVNADKTVSLVAKKNMRYVVAEDSGDDQLRANRAAIGPWEKFVITSHGY